MFIAKSLVLAAAGTLVLVLGAVSAAAQITINIPKIPKIKKEKPTTESVSGSNREAAGSDASYDDTAFRNIVLDSRDSRGGYLYYISPFLDCYGKKHNVDQDLVNSWELDGIDDEKELAHAMEKLAELESRLKSAMRSFPNTGMSPSDNPGLYYEIASKRNEYLQCYREGVKAEAAEKESANDNRYGGIFLEELAAARKEIAEYSPSSKIWLVNTRNSEYLDRAISKQARKEFYDHWSFSASTVAKFDTQFDAMAAEAGPKISAYTASQIAKFNLRNPAEERMMRGAMSDVPGLVVHKIGFYQQTWNIEKNNIGIPIRRYKTGAIYGRNPNSDHPYCWIWTINIRQDYAGGGTYASSYAKYMGRDIASCPGK